MWLEKKTVRPRAGLFDDEVADLLAADRIEAAHRLVEDEQLGRVHDRGGEAGALEHALRERTDATVDGVADADALDDALGLPREVLAVHAVEPSAHRHELARSQVRIDVRVLG